MKYIHSRAFSKFERILNNPTVLPLVWQLREYASSWHIQPNVTPYMIHSEFEKIRAENSIDFSITKADWKRAIQELLDFMSYGGIFPEFYADDDEESMSDAFEQYMEQYIVYFNVPEEKDCTLELIVHMGYYILGVNEGDDPSVLEYFTPLTELASTSREQDSYKKLLEEYDAKQLAVEDDSVLKSLDPVDVSDLPEYVIDSLYLHKGKYYRPSEVRKMITASSQTAQTLEGEDLEGGNEELGLSAEELGRKYIKKLKMRKEKKKDET